MTHRNKRCPMDRINRRPSSHSLGVGCLSNNGRKISSFVPSPTLPFGRSIDYLINNNDEELSTANNSSPKVQLEQVWDALLKHNCCPACVRSKNNNVAVEHDQNCKQTKSKRDWPTYDTILFDVAKADYNKILTCPHNMLHDNQKSFCPHGAICCVKMEMFPLPKQKNNGNNVRPYTGLLTPGKTWEYGLIRLSVAAKPPKLEKASFYRSMMPLAGDRIRNANIFPAAAIKIFRGSTEEVKGKGRKNGTKNEEIPSGNLLFIGSKVGHPETDYFAHCQCTQATEKMPAVIKPFARKAWQYSKTPLALGVSDFCSFDGNGNLPPESISSNFPFCVVLHPCYKSGMNDINQTSCPENSFEKFLDEALAIPINTALFDIFTCPNPKAAADPSQLQRIGRIITTSRVIQSAPDDGIFFKHQRKEEDMELRPTWEDDLETKVIMDGGKTKGTVRTLAGWKLFEEQIQEGVYLDFERGSTQ